MTFCSRRVASAQAPEGRGQNGAQPEVTQERECANMSGAGEAGDDDPIRLENLLADIETRLHDATDGVYAITHMTRDTFNNLLEADGARSGIHYVALKLEQELDVLRERAAEASEAWKRERPENWQTGEPASPTPERQPRG
jgi:hypothetical protein